MNIQPQTSNVPSKIPESVKAGIQSINAGVGNLTTGVSNTFNQFSQQAQTGVGASSVFLQTNTLIAKFAFLILVIIGFILLLYLGIYLIGYFGSPPTNPYLIYGMIDGTSPQTITQDPNNKSSIVVQRSNNQLTGLEYTWSFWMYIKDIRNTNATTSAYSHIFNKGDKYYDATTGLATVNNAPGVYLSNTTNEIRIIVDTLVAGDPVTVIDIPDIPINKWAHIAIRIKNTIMDVYVNGVVAQRLLLSNLPKQNYEDVQICQNGGFSGNLSNLRYYSSALNVFDINSIVTYGPNLTVVDSTQNGSPYYLSSMWYSYNK